MPALQYAATLVEPRQGSVLVRHNKAQDVKIGTRIGRYRITSLLGRGGFGTIWYAHDTTTRKEVAIKVLRPEFITSPGVLARFEREAELIAMLDHPNVVQLLEFGELAGGQPYLVMEYLPGASLAQHLRRHGVLCPREIMTIFESLCDALATAHARGIIHRDIKASNVMLCDEAAGRRVVLLDFGIAKLLETNGPPLTAPLATIGSPFFMAPEQIRGESVDPRTDVYALGILLFELLTGELPFEGEMVLYRHLTEPRPLPSSRCDVTPAFDALVERAMARDPRDRFANTDEFLAALGGAVRDFYGEPEADAGADAGTSRAVGLYLEVGTTASIDGDCDRALDDLESIVPAAEGFLADRGFVVAYAYGNAALFVKPATDSGVAQSCRDAFTDAVSLNDTLAGRAGAHDSVRVGIYLDVGHVEVQDGVVTGGDLVECSPRVDALGVIASETFMRDIRGLADRPSPASPSRPQRIAARGL